ncbi:hypothetical protein [Butyrivibrio sp. MC2021]|uniref:hypothetical protein n=1 Tax=Butyrivibrio sp. MC2021 TaxID=1408306 RepID=UPI000478B9A3|nr:hypothetical protein [Butyrivibrio sp. MC2021]
MSSVDLRFIGTSRTVPTVPLGPAKEKSIKFHLALRELGGILSALNRQTVIDFLKCVCEVLKKRQILMTFLRFSAEILKIEAKLFTRPPCNDTLAALKAGNNISTPIGVITDAGSVSNSL